MANPADAPALSYNERMLETGMAALQPSTSRWR
jgi:hypothetical protein